MKYLLTAFALLIAANTQAQTIAIGTEHLQIGASDNSVFAQASYTQTLTWHLTTKLSLGAGIHQDRQPKYIRNGNNRTNNGVTSPQTRAVIMPGAMIGLELPVKDLSIGIYSGFSSYNLDPYFEPIALTLTF